MKFTLACVAVVLAASSFGMAGARQQETKEALIEAKYFESADRTEVRTRDLPLKREPAQMLGVAFYAGYPTTRLSAPPDVIILRFNSFGHTLLYRQPEQRALTITTDGESWQPAQPLGYAPLTLELNRAKSKKEDPLPDPADFHFMEVMNARISFEQLTRLAHVGQVRLQLGGVDVVVDPRLLEIVRAFAERVTPGAVADAAPAPTRVPRPPKWSDEPSRFGSATLEDALGFLKSELIHNAANESYGGHVNRFDVVAFSSCKVKYRIMPADASAPSPPPLPNAPDLRYTPPGSEYSFNLADLDPASVQISTSDKGSFLSFSTRDHAQKIRQGGRTAASGASR
jgi:hypothetical protein